MLIAHYIGEHKKDGLLARLGWWVIRNTQKGPLKKVTHCEAVLHRCADGTVSIGSSSLRDGGVRIKRGVRLDPLHWLIVDVPAWSVDDAAAWFCEHEGQRYDWRGALATMLPGHHRAGQWYCNEAVGAAAGLQTPECFHPAQFAAVCLTFGRDITAEFFNQP